MFSRNTKPSSSAKHYYAYLLQFICFNIVFPEGFEVSVALLSAFFSKCIDLHLQIGLPKSVCQFA